MTTAFKPEIEEAASLWAARVRSGSLTPGQSRELREWLRRSPAHAAFFKTYCRDSASIDASLLVLRSQGLAVETEGGSVQPRGLARWIAGSLGAAAVALAVAIWPASTQVHLTSPGVRNTITLEDGTRVELNANTRITARFGRSERALHLEQGEALFSAARDPDRPLTVATTQGRVRVTGTVFNVSAHGDSEQSVTVLEGRVEVSGRDAPGAPVALQAGQQAALFGDEPTVRTLSAAELARATSWRRGVLEFDGEPLRSALARVAAYHGCTIEVSSQLDGLTLGGSFNPAELDAFLRAIEQVLPLQVMRDDRRHFRLVPR